MAVLLLLAPVQGAEVILFRVSPESLCIGEAVEAAARVSAPAGEAYRLAVEFRATGGAEGRLDFGAREGPATLVASWLPAAAGPWLARASLPTGGSGEISFQVRECPPAPEGRASPGFALWPRWTELAPGDGVLLDAALTLPPGRFPASLGGPAAPWAGVSPSAAETGPGQPAALALALQVPKDATRGRTALTLSVGPESLTLPVVVKPGAGSLPAVLRSVVQRGNATEVSLRVVNGNLSAPRLEVGEAVEPSLAPTAADLEFIGSAPELLNESPPLLRWVLQDLVPGEERTLTYRVDRTLPPGLPAWPIRQVNVIPRTGAGVPALQVVRLEADPMVSGRPGEVRAEVRNLLAETLVLEAALVLPPGWSTPEPRRTALAPGGSSNLTLSTSPPLFTSGGAMGLLRLKAGTHQLERSFSLAVSQDTGPVAAVVVAVLVAAGLLYLRTRFRSSRRRETLFHLREMRRRLR